MVYTFGSESVLRTITILSKKFILKSPIDINDLRTAYIKFLDSIQPEVPRSKLSDFSILVDAESEKRFSEFFKVDTPLNDMAQTEVLSGSHNSETSARNLDRLNEFFRFGHLREQHASILRLVLTDIFCGRSDVAKGGSASGAIGILWLNQPAVYSDLELIELMSHELTHQLMFLDEQRFNHYLDYRRVALPEFYSNSAILSQPRPLDKVLHSIAVCSEVLAVRRELDFGENGCRIHPASVVLKRQIKGSIDAIRSNKKVLSLLSERSLEIISKCEEGVF